MVTESTTTFGALLRQHRLAAGLTQEQLAERAGMSVFGIQKLERGTTHRIAIPPRGSRGARACTGCGGAIPSHGRAPATPTRPAARRDEHRAA